MPSRDIISDLSYFLSGFCSPKKWLTKSHRFQGRKNKSLPFPLLLPEVLWIQIFSSIHGPRRGFLGDLVVKNPPANAGDTGDMDSIPGSGRSPAGGNGKPLRHSRLENPIERGAWQATVHGVIKNWHHWATDHVHRSRKEKTHVLRGHSEEEWGMAVVQQLLLAIGIG